MIQKSVGSGNVKRGFLYEVKVNLAIFIGNND